MFLFVCLQFYLQDTKSSNGTFINSQRLSRGSEESPPCEIMSGDIIQFGVDVTENTRKGKGMDHFLVSFQVYLFGTPYCNPVFKTECHSHCKITVLFGFFVTSSLLCAGSEPWHHVVPDQETCLLKIQALFLPSHPQMDFTGLFPWPTFLLTVCRGSVGLEKEAQLGLCVHLLPHLN